MRTKGHLIRLRHRHNGIRLRHRHNGIRIRLRLRHRHNGMPELARAKMGTVALLDECAPR